MNAPIRSLRILVADDEPRMLDYYREVLPPLGHEVATASDGRQLIQQYRSFKPDLVITDIKMGDLDGIEAARQINQEAPTPVILVSAFHDDELLNRAESNGVMAYLIKPVKPPDLQAAIALALARFEQMQRLTREAAELRQTLEDRKLVERAKGALMKRAKIDEPEAYRRLQKLASERNIRMAEIARMILMAEEAFNVSTHPEPTHRGR